ncbi:MAG: tetraacyldisaccharide 4'-kinase [Bacteroidetes bacterium]|nr:tetraacyldisaccharide 4'-kinase [Bacteroidota bacterium]
MKLRLLLLPFSFVYSLVAKVRNRFYDRGIFKVSNFPLPIIVVGNLSVGGTGKTPHVEYLIRLLHRKFKVATLSRGYGRRTTGFVVAGKGTTANLIGDEPMQYFSGFDDITVSVCEDRVHGVERLLKLPVPPQVVIMDDGFQHRAIDPGLKIILTPADQPFTHDYLLPAGNLREGREGYRRADILIVSKCDPQMSEAAKLKLRNEINPLSHQQLFFSSVTYGELMPVSDGISNLCKNPSQSNVILLTGIANPAPIVNYLTPRVSGLHLMQFPDHHIFSDKDMNALQKKFNSFAPGTGMIVTTEKDLQRLKQNELKEWLDLLPFSCLPITVSIDNEPEFNKLIESYVAKNKGNS